MTEPAALDSATANSCPICLRPNYGGKRPKRLYGHEVCRKCMYRLANRRQLAFIIDSVTIIIGCRIISSAVLASQLVYGRTAGPGSGILVGLATTLLGQFLLALRDGFAGRSLGKLICGVRVVRAESLEPIGFGASFVRNLPILGLQLLPWPVGLMFGAAGISLASLGTFLGLLIMAFMMNSGPRWGDGWAGTKVIWEKYSHRVPFDLRGILCTDCGYNLTGNISGVCPECGHAIARAES